MSQSAAASEAKSLAPAAFARAEKLRGEAEAAADHGDGAAAAILGERALAAYGEATALARVARADRARVDAEARLKTAQAELGGLEGEESRIHADADAIELQIKVFRDAQAIVPSGKADPEREKARLTAARALALQARLLCAAGKLLGPKDPKLVADLDAASAAVDKVADKLGPQATLAPIDEATRARAACLSALTLARRAETPVATAPGVGDGLLAELSAAAAAQRGGKGDASLAPTRDDRGVIVTLRGAFQGEQLSAGGQKQIAALARVAAAHPTFPVEVVVHGGPAKGDQARADAAARALTAAAPGGALKVAAIGAAEASPIVDPQGAAKARNTRLEIVFVTPQAF